MVVGHIRGSCNNNKDRVLNADCASLSTDVKAEGTETDTSLPLSKYLRSLASASNLLTC